MCRDPCNPSYDNYLMVLLLATCVYCNWYFAVSYLLANWTLFDKSSVTIMITDEFSQRVFSTDDYAGKWRVRWMFCDDSSLLSLPSKHCNRACVIFVNFYKSIPVSSMNLGMFSESRREIMSLLELEWFLLARCMTTLSFREFDSCEGIVGGILSRKTVCC